MQSKLFLFLFIIAVSSISFQSCTSSSEEQNSEADKNVIDTTITSSSDSDTEVKTEDNETAESVFLNAFELTDCQSLVEKEFNCSCVFSTGDFYKGSTIFASDWDKKACVKVEDELNALYPDWEERNYKNELKELAEFKTWVIVNKQSIKYFGKSVEEHKYSNALDLLIDVILASGKDITAIPIENNAEGMAIREVRDLVADAITKANMYKSKGGDDPLIITKYDNRKYDVFVRYRQITQYEGEANKYEGTLTLLKNRDTKILETVKINGTCGC